ncbi:hypothetical protein EYF80_040004 [Liparis tanakae]|uniref:Uncharacterized protein n=1 Tax=Liparis tanakae TaxID=230148 RepID=A0A4Z2G9B2_9TELE|nr:hypothetical protein EYF80_040004 [Liparis tanakae]
MTAGHLVEMGDALPALPQTRGLQALEDSGEGAAGPALQWCRLSVRLKSEVQFMHIIAWETGTSTGAASPRAIHNFSRAWSTKRTESRGVVGYGSAQRVEPVLPLSDGAAEGKKKTSTSALEKRSLGQFKSFFSCRETLTSLTGLW